MAIVYDPKKMLKKIAPKKKIERLISSDATLKKTALSFVNDIDFISKKDIAKVALKTVQGYQERLEKITELTPEEKRAIGSYKGTGYAQINGVLRGNKVREPEKAKELAERLDSAIKKADLAKDITVYRGMYNVPDIRNMGSEGVGKEISMPTFWSVSPDKKTADQFTMANSQKTGVLFEIKLKAGDPALDATAGTDEKEFLLPRGQKYKVVDFKPGKGDAPPTYVLEVVPNERRVSAAEKKEELQAEITKNPVQLIQRVQNAVVWQMSKSIREKYQGEFYIWLPSDANEPDPEHQLNYGKKFQIDDGEMPGDRDGCRCGMQILVQETKLEL